MRRLFLLLALCVPLPALAQIGLYGTFSASNFRVANTGWNYGSTFGIYDNHWTVPFFALGIDGRGAVVGSGSTKFDSGLVGPRLVFKPHVLPIMPYVEALGGVGHAEFGEGAAQTSTTKFAYNFVGGIDYTFFPRLDWRVVDFSYGGLSAFDGSFNPRTLSTGIVFRLP
ncbi:hypothetical protein [Acidipila sp. EB88]|uniref:hypothetical protein n=1 Tax=Acidipila sp. EB88 TaxID=2305226 RepID=UPI000F5F646D|nr:hypothetical protein [Acidipila sp. EB88]RRA49451.1 hypothetical protein D1Y84_15360 [Acidipila sp. EB88]